MPLIASKHVRDYRQRFGVGSTSFASVNDMSILRELACIRLEIHDV